MGVVDWVRRSAANVRTDGADGLRDAIDELYGGLWRTLGWHVPRGTNIYEFEWDALIILDACRVDLMGEVAPEYGFIGEVESMTSVGSMSQEWMAKTFTNRYINSINDTAYVTANVFSGSVLDRSQFLGLDEVWRYAWDDDLGIVPPRPVTDRAISVGRESDADRLIVHYMQPHHPFIADTAPESFDSDPFGRGEGETVVDALRRGKISKEAFWEAYRANLRTALDDISLLLSSIDAETVVLTADHGDALGEWGIYDHPAGCLHPSVSRVPWIETTAEDIGEYQPTVEREAGVDEEVTGRLRSLGYV